MTDWSGCGGSPPEPTRRRLLGAFAAGGTVALAGCTLGTEDEPDANVVRYEAEPPVDDIRVQQRVTVTALVVNHATAGRVEVVAETLTDGREEPLDSHTLTIELDATDQRTIEFEMEVSPATDLLEMHAEPA